MRIIVGITGSSGVEYGIKLLEVCQDLDIQTDLVISPAAEKIIDFEVEENLKEVKEKATKCFEHDNLGAPISSGSVKTNGMVIVPCTMKTLGSLASGVTNNLIARAADVTLKEDRKLVIVPRETPLNLIHIENMKKLNKAGAKILPATPAFYHNPQNINDLLNFIAGKILDQFNTEHPLYQTWNGLKE